MTRNELRSVLQEYFDPADAERVEPWCLPAIGFHDVEVGAEPDAVGTTRFGGRPDLPPALPWPVGPNGPLAFLGQISLSEIAPFDIDHVLPPSGILAFFYSIDDYAWGFDPTDAEKFKVVSIEEGVPLKRRRFPQGIAKANRLTRCRPGIPYLRWSLPTADSLARETLRCGEIPTVSEPASDTFSEAFWDLHWDLAETYRPEGSHQLLGWANGIYQQGEDCRLMCEVARHGFPDDEMVIAAAKGGRQHWRCLLQVDEDERLHGDYFADGGTIAFMIHETDLRSLDFSRCWCVLSSS